MPNWCYNRVTAYGNEDKLKEIEKIFESKTPFNDIFPMPDWKNTPNENGSCQYYIRNLIRMVTYFMRHTTFQMARMMTDGITGALRTGTPSGSQICTELSTKTQKFWHLHLIPHGVHQRESQQNCVKSSQMFLFSVSLMNQDVKLQGIINGIM